MTLADDRAAIRAALTDAAVPDVHAYDFKPAAPGPGDAYPVWGGGERGPGDTFVHTWALHVILPQMSERDAALWLDGRASAIVDALAPLGYVDRYEPVIIETTDGEMLGARFTMRSE